MGPSTTPLIALGEVRTCLVPASATLHRAEAGELLALVPGRRVLWRQRPCTLAVSPTTPVGVDCKLLLPDAEPVRVVGTVAGRAVVTGGRVLQSSVRTQVIRAADRRRQTWSHYLSRVGVTEVLDRLGDRETACDALADGYLDGRPSTDTLDLASISERLLARLRADPRLDQQAPLQVATTRLRWTAKVGGSVGPKVRLRLDDDSVRSAWIIVRSETDLDAAQRFCEDLAAHDWLLTIGDTAIEEADRFPASSREQMEILAAVLEHLAHLWMPGAHTPPALRSLWKDLQSDPGFSRQWTALIGQVRDRLRVAQWNNLSRRIQVSTTEW
ncbi:SCO2521 family protein [Nocardia suismassiliense]|uniref:SCO2521 family protein n=1 Tax=Nocardia suismassiliense TaxID=2077092 RepID=A0ABW6R581_9NOCA